MVGLRITGDKLNPQQAARLLGRIAQGAPWECWPWLGSVAPNGYGQVVWRVAGLQLRYTPHRLALELFTGRPVPAGYEVDYVCNCRLCCNPAHLEPVTHAENIRRMYRRRGRSIRDHRRNLAHLAAIQGELGL